jgi:hypothetical protein
MRTKILLLSAVALATGLVSSFAQSNVYSVNVVGYANIPTRTGISSQGNQFNAAGGNNSANNVIANTGQWDGSELQFWTGINYSVAVFDSLTDDTTTGFTDRIGNPIPSPNIGNAVGYYFNNLSGVSNNITYVGDVRVGTNSVVLTRTPAISLHTSQLPVGGGIISALSLSNPGGALDGCEIQIPVINAGGNISGFSVAVFDSLTDDTTTGFTDRIGNPVPEPQLKVGQSFFFNNLSTGNQTWTQVYTNGP